MLDLVKRIPLLVRLALALALVSLVPLAYAIWSLYDVNRAGMHEQVLRTHAVAASTAADRIAGLVESRATLARTLAGNPMLSESPRSPEATRFLQELLAADASIEAVDLIDASGETVVRAQRRGAAEEAGLASHGGGAPPARLWTAAGKSWLLVSEPLTGSPGWVRVLAGGGPIAAALEPAEIGENAQMVLASAEGALAGSARLETFPAQMIAAARSARVTGTGAYAEPSGAEVVGAFAPVGGGWYVLSRQPAAIAESIALKMRRRAVLAAAVALLLAAVIAFAAHRGVVRPIHDIVAAQQRLAGSAPLPAGNEIDQLRVGAEMIERRIADQEELGRVFLGRYQVLGIIGQGGMGTVFRGWDPKLRRHVALKTVRLEGILEADDEDPVTSLVSEAITAASFSHPNIVSVFDVEDSPSAAFVAMELVDGLSLQSYLDQRDRMTAAQTVHVGLAVARALDAAHARSLLHRDIKPANVLLGFDGSLKVTDFGVASLISRLSQTPNTVFGTPGYIAPEAATGKPTDTRSDLFALGVILYECLTGSNPFNRRSSRDTLIATVVTAPLSLSSAVEGNGLLHEISPLVSAMMQKKPEDRPDTAGIVVSELERMVRGYELQWHIDTEGTTQLMRGHGSARLVPTIALERT